MKPVARKRGKALWTFLNSSFGLFLLSSVFLSGITYFFSQASEYEKDRAARQERIDHLDLEIAYRISFLVPLEKPQFNYTEMNNAMAVVMGDPQNDPTIGRLDEFNPIFPEYRSRTLLSLLLELRGTVPSSEKPDIDKAFHAAKGLFEFADYQNETVLQIKPKSDGQDSLYAYAPKDQARFKNIVDALDQPRWSF